MKIRSNQKFNLKSTWVSLNLFVNFWYWSLISFKIALIWGYFPSSCQYKKSLIFTLDVIEKFIFKACYPTDIWSLFFYPSTVLKSFSFNYFQMKLADGERDFFFISVFHSLFYNYNASYKKEEHLMENYRLLSTRVPLYSLIIVFELIMRFS